MTQQELIGIRGIPNYRARALPISVSVIYICRTTTYRWILTTDQVTRFFIDMWLWLHMYNYKKNRNNYWKVALAYSSSEEPVWFPEICTKRKISAKNCKNPSVTDLYVCDPKFWILLCGIQLTHVQRYWGWIVKLVLSCEIITLNEASMLYMWRSRTTVGVRCAHFPSVITAIMDQKQQLLKPLNKRESYTT
jgi:hypothetical protein